jgi:hypothetical protein
MAMTMHDLSFRCLLRQCDTRAVASMEARGARRGACVEIWGEGGLRDVADVYRPSRTAAWLNDNAGRVRKGLPSIGSA